MEKGYHAIYRHSIEQPEHFWSDVASAVVHWQRTWKAVRVGDFSQGHSDWFVGGQLNVSENCLDRHLATRGDQVAIIWEGDDSHDNRTLTYRELYEQVCRLANVLKKKGIMKGDRVCIYLPMIPEIAVAMLACTRVGAVHTVVFGGFSPEALKTRIKDCEPKLVITADEGVRGGKRIPLKHNVNEALKADTSVNFVIVVKRTGENIAWQERRDSWYHQEIADAQVVCEPEVMEANDPLFILYTSGSTGKPKGILHTTGGYFVYVTATFKHIFDYREKEIYWCTADAGWITGHSYLVYGPLSNGATTLIFEGVPHYPTFSRCWEIIDKYNVNIFYTAPTAIRALRREGDEWVNACTRKSLRLLGTVGEPINPEVWEWYHRVVGEGRCDIVDTWWQTETGGILLSPIPGQTPLKPGAASWPFFGIVPAIVDEDGQHITNNESGRLVITAPWPGMMKTIYGDHPRFLATYFTDVKGVYLTGDRAHCDPQGYYWISGRNDDVIKISGHRIGTEEVESAILEHPAVSEAAVVPVEHEIKGQSIYAFVITKNHVVVSNALKEEIMQTVRQQIGAIAVPEQIQWASGLPKTRSGKIMRRILRKIANHDEANLGDTSTLADSAVIDALIQGNESVEKR